MRHDSPFDRLIAVSVVFVPSTEGNEDEDDDDDDDEIWKCIFKTEVISVIEIII